ncbi:Uncharacterised protein [Vibrio cholerae]|nr:Uncharacterised protein [Vibrio cholerae]
MTLPLFSILVTSITCATDSLYSISRICASQIPCSSRAAWYSAFSFKSPSSRASAIASVILGLSFNSLSSSSRSSFSPRAVIGTFSIIYLCAKVFLWTIKNFPTS